MARHSLKDGVRRKLINGSTNEKPESSGVVNEFSIARNITEAAWLPNGRRYYDPDNSPEATRIATDTIDETPNTTTSNLFALKVIGHQRSSSSSIVRHPSSNKSIADLSIMRKRVQTRPEMNLYHQLMSRNTQVRSTIFNYIGKLRNLGRNGSCSLKTRIESLLCRPRLSFIGNEIEDENDGVIVALQVPDKNTWMAAKAVLYSRGSKRIPTTTANKRANSPPSSGSSEPRVNMFLQTGHSFSGPTKIRRITSASVKAQNLPANIKAGLMHQKLMEGFLHGIEHPVSRAPVGCKGS